MDVVRLIVGHSQCVRKAPYGWYFVPLEGIEAPTYDPPSSLLPNMNLPPGSDAVSVYEALDARWLLNSSRIGTGTTTTDVLPPEQPPLAPLYTRAERAEKEAAKAATVHAARMAEIESRFRFSSSFVPAALAPEPPALGLGSWTHAASVPAVALVGEAAVGAAAAAASRISVGAADDVALVALARALLATAPNARACAAWTAADSSSAAIVDEWSQLINDLAAPDALRMPTLPTRLSTAPRALLACPTSCLGIAVLLASSQRSLPEASLSALVAAADAVPAPSAIGRGTSIAIARGVRIFRACYSRAAGAAALRTLGTAGVDELVDSAFAPHAVWRSAIAQVSEADELTVAAAADPFLDALVRRLAASGYARDFALIGGAALAGDAQFALSLAEGALADGTRALLSGAASTIVASALAPALATEMSALATVESAGALADSLVSRAAAEGGGVPHVWRGVLLYWLLQLVVYDRRLPRQSSVVMLHYHGHSLWPLLI